MLEDECELVTTVDSAAAVAMAEQEKSDLILMDISLSGLDGYKATAKIKATPELAHIPVFALTAHAMSGDEEKALAAGCDGYLAKPLDDDLLFDTPERLL